MLRSNLVAHICETMDKLQLTGRNLGRVFNLRSGCVCAMQLSCFETKLPNLMLKTRPKQLLSSLPFERPIILLTSWLLNTATRLSYLAKRQWSPISLGSMLHFFDTAKIVSHLVKRPWSTIPWTNLFYIFWSKPNLMTQCLMNTSITPFQLVNRKWSPILGKYSLMSFGQIQFCQWNIWLTQL